MVTNSKKIGITLKKALVKPGIILIALLFISFYTQAQISTYKGQALFIWNFTKHIKWDNSSPSFVIGVAGKSHITEELVSSLKGKLVDNKPIEIRTIASTAEASECQIIYIPTSKSKEAPSFISSSVNKLIITEDDLVVKGAGISFVTVDEKLRFKINEPVLSKNKLQVSGGLLSLALRG